MKKGVILNNIGSPNAPDTKSVRIYLREFLMDPGVIELPYLLRFFLVNLIIVPFRSPKSAAKYRKIWTDKGSPLVAITNSIAAKMQNFSNNLVVETGMLFQNPSLKLALRNLLAKEPSMEKIYFIPMYPQYSIATTEASITKLKSVWQKEKSNYPTVKELFALRPFYNFDSFINNNVKKLQEFPLQAYDHIVFSYHGLPTSAILKNPHCRMDKSCCQTGMKANCYRSQCFETTRLIAEKLNVTTPTVTTFQSRLGRGEWIRPYTDEVLVEFAQKEIKKILVICPAFTVDCLETLEEIQIENRDLFIKAGGEKLDYVPCLNDGDQWCQDLTHIIEDERNFDRL